MTRRAVAAVALCVAVAAATVVSLRRDHIATLEVTW